MFELFYVGGQWDIFLVQILFVSASAELLVCTLSPERINGF